MNSPNLYALIIRLIADQNGRLSATDGHLCHAAFLDILRQVDPDLSQTLHNMNGRKPFTLSPLHGYGYGRKGQRRITAGQEGWLRITLLDPTLFHTFIQYFLQPANRPTIQLEKQQFHVTEILSSPGSHPLAGYDSLQNLQNKWEQPTNQPANLHTIQLNFRTPTAFSRRNPEIAHRYIHVLPDPHIVFGELAGYWDNLTGSRTQEVVRQYAADHVVVARHTIKTHMYQYSKAKQIGFTGRVTFQILDQGNTDLICHLNRLADLAFYTGVGSRTGMGMGQVSRIMNYEG